MRFEGTLKAWNEDRGFGFIVPDRGADEIFVHIKAYSGRNVRPKVGDRVTFEVEPGPQGKKRAKNVRPFRATHSEARKVQDQPAKWDLASLAAIPVLVALYFLASQYWSVSPLWAAAYVLVSLMTLFAYAFDKTAAVRGNWRTSEATLLGLGLLCGWPGALFAQKGLRHKSRKASFRRVFWITVVLNVAGFLVLSSPVGAELLQHLRVRG